MFEQLGLIGGNWSNDDLVLQKEAEELEEEREKMRAEKNPRRPTVAGDEPQTGLASIGNTTSDRIGLYL